MEKIHELFFWFFKSNWSYYLPVYSRWNWICFSANEALSSQNKKLADDLATEKGNNSTLEGEKAALANDADKAKKDLEAAKETITKTEKEITTLRGNALNKLWQPYRCYIWDVVPV